ncbi:MAG: hypothetical protein HY951_04775 [Bacteroidia bacterium]|nr:hypothetical protein [Bacteroidia bacterium]
MKAIKKILLIILLSNFSNLIFSQTDNLLTELPDSTREAFIKSEKQLLNTINWLNNTPINKDVDFRRTQMALLYAWLVNSPTVTIEIDYSVLPFTKKNPELLATFFGGWAKYSIENSYSEDLIKCNLAGIRSAVSFYKKGNGLKSDKKMDEIIELENKNELENWVKKQLKKK